MSFTISERCTGCAACVSSCPTGAIHGENRRLHVIDPARCIDCGACGVACRDEAVFDHQGVPFSLCEPRTRALAWVDLALCSGCGWCSEVCPWDAVSPWVLRKGDGVVVRLAAVEDSRCVACGACQVECGRGAIRLMRPRDPEVAVVCARNADFLEDLAGITRAR